MSKQLKIQSSNNSLEFYTSEINIPNQPLVRGTIEYFTTGPGKRAFKPLPFLNLLHRQYNFVNENIVTGSW